MIEFLLKVVISLVLWVVVARVFLYFGKKIFKDQVTTKGHLIFIK